jgi:hypothetical protein
MAGQIEQQEDGTGPLFNVRPGGRCFAQAESTKRKLSAAHMGKKLSEAHKEAVRRTLTGRKQSDELKARHSIRMKQWWAERKSILGSRS